MARNPDLWLRRQTGFWMTTIQGVQHKLSKDKGEARRMLNKLLGSDQPTPRKAGMTARKLFDVFLTRTEGRREPNSQLILVAHLKAFCEAYGHRDPATLKVHEVETWVDARETWSPSTRALFVSIIKSACNWAEEQGYLAANPLKKLKWRSTGRRSRLLTPEEKSRIEAAVNDRFKDFLLVISRTGCRPFSEAAKLTAGMIDWEKGRAELKKHKTAKKTKRPRHVYFPKPVLDRLKVLAAERPEGPLLVNRYGEAWTPGTAGTYFRRVCRRLGIEGVSSYTLRHSWITNALVNGVPVEVVAHLAGNTPGMIHNNYSQVDQMTDALRAAAEKAAG